MASTITKTKTIRIKNGIYDYFEKLPLNRIVESLGELMQSGKIKFDGEKLILKGCSQKKEISNDLKDIDEMASLMHVSTEKILSDVKELIENGDLYYSCGKLINPKYEDFEKAFDENERDLILEKVIQEYGK